MSEQERRSNRDAAKTVCGRCPVRGECLESAMVEEVNAFKRYTIRGGLTPDERTRTANRSRRYQHL